MLQSGSQARWIFEAYSVSASGRHLPLHMARREMSGAAVLVLLDMNASYPARGGADAAGLGYGRRLWG